MLRIEALKIKDLWFSGKSAQILTFLCHVQDFLHVGSSLFQLETWRVVWIARHFGYHLPELWKNPSLVENWHCSLFIDNACWQGKVNFYADLEGKEFQHPVLMSVTAFLDGFIAVFGDRIMKENAKRALSACKQGKLTIGEYNSQLKSLVYLVKNVEEARIEKYVCGLNPWIIRQSLSK